MPVRVADRDVVAPSVVLLEHGNDLLRREPVDRGHDRRVDQAAVGQRQEVEAVVDHVELVRLLEHRRDVQRLPGLGMQCRILGVAGRRRANEASGRDGVGSREQGDVDTAPDQALGQEGGELFPRTVLPRRHAPGDRREQCDPQSHPYTVRGSGNGALLSCWASARAAIFASDCFSIWRTRSRVTLKTSPISSSVRGCSPSRP